MLASPSPVRIFSTDSRGRTSGDFSGTSGDSISATASCGAPAVSMTLLSMSTMTFPRHFITMRFVSVTVATTTAFKFSAFAAAMNFSTFSFLTTTAILS